MSFATLPTSGSRPGSAGVSTQRPQTKEQLLDVLESEAQEYIAKLKEDGHDKLDRECECL